MNSPVAANKCSTPSNSPTKGGGQPFNSKLMMDAWDPFSPRHNAANTAWKNSLTPNILCYDGSESSSLSLSRTGSISNGSSTGTTTTNNEEEQERDDATPQSTSNKKKTRMGAIRRLSQLRKSRKDRGMVSDAGVL